MKDIPDGIPLLAVKNCRLYLYLVVLVFLRVPCWAHYCSSCAPLCCAEHQLAAAPVVAPVSAQTI